DLAALTGIPARQLAEIEYGLRRLSAAERDQLALVLGLHPHDFTGAHRRLAADGAGRPVALALPLPPAADRQAAQAVLTAALAAAVAAGSIGAVVESMPPIAAPRWSLAAPAPAPTALPTAAPAPAPARVVGSLNRIALDPAGDDAALLWQRALVNLSKRAAFIGEALAPALASGPAPGEEVAPAPLPAIATAPAFALTEQGPLGCPVRPAVGRVVMTQGYGVGTHAPAAIWGAVDLAVDGDGDGYAEPGASWYAPIVATHDGHVTVTLNSHPAGNHVWVNEPGGVWRTGYAHLAVVTVVSGQFVRAGEQIGLLGSTGMSSGPHLDYQVWRGGENLDPTWLVGC
ncbi:MAG TPA: peptidoglycan DD-metalloendopeptidase family protein, partial [Chloroflexaceae bacterium]|nr:peptidoglycan DD-metalloendopeptidase family protein [Chloroflexaceae bacterium]